MTETLREELVQGEWQTVFDCLQDFVWIDEKDDEIRWTPRGQMLDQTQRVYLRSIFAFVIEEERLDPQMMKEEFDHLNLITAESILDSSVLYTKITDDMWKIDPEDALEIFRAIEVDLRRSD